MYSARDKSIKLECQNNINEVGLRMVNRQMSDMESYNYNAGLVAAYRSVINFIEEREKEEL